MKEGLVPGLFIGSVTGICVGALGMRAVNNLFHDKKNEIILNVKGCDEEWRNLIQNINWYYQYYNDDRKKKIKKSMEKVHEIQKQNYNRMSN